MRQQSGYLPNYYQKNRKLIDSQTQNAHRKQNQKRRLELMQLLGGAKCIKCGFSDIRALQFDHINGKGNLFREKIGGYTHSVIFYSKNPDIAKHELQVLCANCNWIKRYENNEVKQKIYKQEIPPL